MLKVSLLAAAAAVLVASPLSARPMTARDMHSMHRLGAPEVSRDGRYAVFTVSRTDWDKNKRVNTLYLLDLTRQGATPQPVLYPIPAAYAGTCGAVVGGGPVVRAPAGTASTNSAGQVVASTGC